MAGSPQNRARRLAEQARRDENTGDWMIRPPPNLTDPPKAPPTDRELVSVWWREQVADLKRAAKGRGETVAKGADAVLESQARVFGALGVPEDVAAALMGVGEVRFKAEYAGEYAVGSAAMVGQVAANLLRIATSTNDRVAVKAAVEIMRSRGGEPWRPPTQKLEISRPAPKANVIDSSKLTVEERAALRAIIMAASAREQLSALEHGGGGDE
jgi:hypothetical protein